MSIYEKAYNNCIKKGLINSNCDKFLKLDFTMKLKRCRTTKCKKYYRSKLKKLSKRKSPKKSPKKSLRKSLRKSPKKSFRRKSLRKSIRKSLRKSRRKSLDGDGIPVIKKYKRCYAFKGFW